MSAPKDKARSYAVRLVVEFRIHCVPKYLALAKRIARREAWLSMATTEGQGMTIKTAKAVRR